MCGQIEQKFLVGPNPFLFGDKATIVDFVFYQELVSAMILSGNGSQNEFLSVDKDARTDKLTQLTAWYN